MLETTVPSPELTRLVTFFEQLSTADLARIDQFYAPSAHFKDPFNQVQGPQAIAAVFAHMFKTLNAPRFVVLGALEDHPAAGRALLTWDFRFHFAAGQAAQCIHGATELRWDTQGRITWHRDYWDAAEELYEKLPVLGALMRWLKRRARA